MWYIYMYIYTNQLAQNELAIVFVANRYCRRCLSRLSLFIFRRCRLFENIINNHKIIIIIIMASES